MVNALLGVVPVGTAVHHRTALYRTEIDARAGPGVDAIRVGAPPVSESVGQVGDRAGLTGADEEFGGVDAAGGHDERLGDDFLVFQYFSGFIGPFDVEGPLAVGGAPGDLSDGVQGPHGHESGALGLPDVGGVDAVLATVVHADGPSPLV